MASPGPNGANRQRINFQKSDLRWVTQKEKSHGSFKLEAVLRLWAERSASPTVWALGTAVLAGNMYADVGLPKFPPWMFQVAAGVSDHVIFRTELSRSWSGWVRRLLGASDAPPVTDTLNLNSETFDSLELYIETESASAARHYDDIASHYFLRDHFTGLITINLPEGGKVEMEFPVKHLNLWPERKRWQLETGPVLFVKQPGELASGGIDLADLLPCFVHANRLDAVEFSPDFPFPRYWSSRMTRAGAQRLPCTLQMLVSDRLGGKMLPVSPMKAAISS